MTLGHEGEYAQYLHGIWKLNGYEDIECSLPTKYAGRMSVRLHKKIDGQK